MMTKKGEIINKLHEWASGQEVNQYKLLINIKIRSNFPANHVGTNVAVKFPVPKSCTGATFELPKGI